jgi:Iap family predicted aminopeptidase
MTPEQAIDFVFEDDPHYDKIYVNSNDAQIVSTNSKLNNIIKAPIILAAEMIQEYKVRQDDGEGHITIHTEKHFKPYSELKKAALLANEYGSLDMIVEHKDTYNEDEIIG